MISVFPYTKLSYKCALYVPSTNSDGVFDNKEYVKKAQQFFTSVFGGSTSVVANGHWIDDNGNMVEESVTIVYAYSADKLFGKIEEEIYALALSMKNETKQDIFAVTINNEMAFI